jgi:EmrB/QacA subfamily drug resistance transporter
VSVETRPIPPADAAGAPPAAAAATPRLGLLLGVCCVAQFMVILDLSIVNVALPNIQSDLSFTAPQLQWVVDAYAISFAGFLMLGGRAADHFGRRRMFVLALLLFGVTSLVGGLAPDQLTLIGARAVQGVGGALMAACSLAIITASFPAGPKLHRAIGVWAAMNGLGGSAGVVLGGLITEVLSWRWVLLINPPIALATAFVAYRVVSERRRAKQGDAFDLAGALTLTLGQVVLVFGVVEAGLKGWSTAAALGPIAGGVALLGLFGYIETHASRPLIPFKDLSLPLQAANGIVLLFSATIFPMWILSSLYLQQVLGLTPLTTGLVFLPMTAVIAVVANQAGRLVSQFGARAVLGSGLVLLTAGMVLLARIGPSGSGWVYIMIPGLLTAAGIAMAIVPSTIAATQGAKEGQAGLVSGLVNTSRQVGGGLGLAVLITLATQHTTHLIGAGEQVPDALTHGFRLGFWIGACLAAAAALLTFVALPRPSAAPALPVRRLVLATVLVLGVFAGLTAAFAGSKAPPIGRYSTANTYSYVTEPSLHPPVVRVSRHGSPSQLAPGYIFTANFYNLNEPPIVGQSGPLILDSDMQPVWFQPVPEKVVAANLSLQSYEGKPVLAWWQGFVTNTGSTESGEYVVVDQHYQPVARLKATDGWVLTLHEIVIRGHDAWVTANKNLARDLSSYGGAYNGALIDSAVQEYDLRTGRLLRNWDALDHISLRESEATLPTNGFPWDAYHVNSIALVGANRFLVSMRNTWAAYMVNAETGRIEWTLGGKHSSFRFGAGAQFEWQHNVTMPSSSTVSVFDDHCCRQKSGGASVAATGPSRGLVLHLDEATRTVSLVAQYGEHDDIESEYMGDTDPQPNGNVFIGWGSEPYFTEYSRSGELLLEGQLPSPNLSYRATLEQWVGLPLTAPAGAARRHGASTTVYASWNGATQLRRWRVLAASSAGARMRVLTTHAKSGFETAMPVPAGYTSFELQALDAAGRVIGTSRPFTAA